MENQNFESAWKEDFRRQSDRRNGMVCLIILILGTAIIIPDVLLAEAYPLWLTALRAGVSLIGFVGYLLFRLKKISNRVMVLLYAVPMFALTAFIVALQTDIVAVLQITNTLGIVGLFFVAFFILSASSWILIGAVLYISYFLSLSLIGPFPLSDYLSHGGFLILLGFLTFPFITSIRYRLIRENFKLQFEINSQKNELEFYANNDILTGVYNRRGGMTILGKMIKMSKRHDIPLTISFIDINGLKRVNDDYGHAVGDRLIRIVADLLKERIRVSDTLFRVGGDEFIAAFPGCRTRESRDIMESVRSAAAELSAGDSCEFPVAFSFGIAEYDGSMSIDDLIKAADREMYLDKH